MYAHSTVNLEAGYYTNNIERHDKSLKLKTKHDNLESNLLSYTVCYKMIGSLGLKTTDLAEIF